MAKKKFTMVVTGQQGVNDNIRGYMGRINDFRPVWDVINLDIIRIVLSHFTQQMGPDKPWQDFAARLSGEYRVRKVYRHSGALLTEQSKLLMDTGFLRNSIQVLRSMQKELAVGTNVIYAGTHQFGNSRFNIPARPFIWLSSADEKAIVNSIGAYVGAKT